MNDDQNSSAVIETPPTEPKRVRRPRGKRPGTGFAAMSPEKRSSIASEGGKAAHRQGKAHEFTKEEAIEAGRKGGKSIGQNREHMVEIGRKGGKQVSRDRGHMSEIGRKGGETIGRNRKHMAEIGRKGGKVRGRDVESGAAEIGQ